MEFENFMPEGRLNATSVCVNEGTDSEFKILEITSNTTPFELDVRDYDQGPTFTLRWPGSLDTADIDATFKFIDDNFEVTHLDYGGDDDFNSPTFGRLDYMEIEAEGFNLTWTVRKNRTLPEVSISTRHMDYLSSMWLQEVIDQSRFSDSQESAYIIIEEFLETVDKFSVNKYL